MIDSIRPVGASPASSLTPSAGAGLTAIATAASGVEGADFGTTLMQLTSNAANVVRQAEATSIAGVQGQASVQQVVEAVMAAEQTLQGAVAIRDKVVAAYLEISRMQI